VLLPSGATARIKALRVQFPRAQPARPSKGVLRPTYTSKPLVLVDGLEVLGELAIVYLLGKDRWVAVWVDTFHSRKFWSAMPNESQPVQLPPAGKRKYDEIVAVNGKASSFFDVI
jgi:hypothetical protein